MSELYNALQRAAKSINEGSSTNGAGAQIVPPPVRSGERTPAAAVLEPPAETAPASNTITQRGLDRRKRSRAHVKMPAGVRSSQSITDSFREVVTTENASRDGLCFRSRAKYYQSGMQLRVTFPYSAQAQGIAASENCAEVVRLETMPDGSSLVAVSFSPRSHTVPANPVATGQRPGDKRRHKRCEVSAVAQVREASSEANSVTVMNARCSELAMGGCYIDTLNPFNIGTHVHVEIQKGDRVLAASGTVCTSHRGSGMGLSFHNLTPEQMATLFAWLE